MDLRNIRQDLIIPGVFCNLFIIKCTHDSPIPSPSPFFLLPIIHSFWEKAQETGKNLLSFSSLAAPAGALLVLIHPVVGQDADGTHIVTVTWVDRTAAAGANLHLCILQAVRLPD